MYPRAHRAAEGGERACNVHRWQNAECYSTQNSKFTDKHMNRRHAPLMRSLTAKWFFEMAGLQHSYLMTT